MKKIAIILSFFLWINSKAQTWVTIPDTFFVYTLQAQFPSAMNGNSLNINNTAITTCTQIVNLNGNGHIKDYTGIQYFTSLLKFDCNISPAENLSVLPNSLIYLDCSFCNLSNLPVLPSSLKTLRCYGNSQLTSLPALPNTLTYLDCSLCNLTSLPNLPNSLVSLWCYNNHISCFPPLPNLTYIDLHGNPFNCLPNHPNGFYTYYPLCYTGNSHNCSVVAPDCNLGLTFTLGTGNQAGTVNFSIVSSGYSNTWSFGDVLGSPQNGSNVQHSYVSNGTYTVQCVTRDSLNQIECISTDVIIITNSVANVIKNGNISDKIVIYPNPSNGNFVIETTSTEKQNITIQDLNGRIISKQDLNGKTNIDVTYLADGVYNLIIKTNEAVFNRKVIILR